MCARSTAGVARELPSPEVMRDVLVEQNERPFQAEPRIEEARPRRELRRIVEQRRDARRERTPLRAGHLHRRVEQKIGDGLRRVIPAEILEVNEREPPFAVAQRVVKAEVGGAQCARRKGQVLVATQAVTADLRRRPRGE